MNFRHKKIKVQLGADALGQYTINLHSLVEDWYTKCLTSFVKKYPSHNYKLLIFGVEF